MKLHVAKIMPLLVLMIVEVSCQSTNKKHKRQIFREQLLPALGGKIPEEAFRTDRLALNRLNKEGITVIDGVLLEARDHDKNPDSVRSKPELIKVYVTQDPRYVPPEGRYHNQQPKTVDTTYVLRKPVGHHSASEQPSPNINLNVPSHQRDQYQLNNNDNVNNKAVNTVGCGRSSALPIQRLISPKAHAFASFPTFVTYKPPANDYADHRQRHYPIIYEPIIAPLVIPPRGTYYGKAQRQNLQHRVYDNPAAWDSSYDWSSFYRSREPLFIEDDTDFFDSHQIITDYEGFLNTFHGRAYRHVGSSPEANLQEKKLQGRSNTISDRARSGKFADSEKSASTDFSLISRNRSPSYTDLTSIPTTGFSCGRRKGTFADVETKCQVFHECSGWSMTSSLCPTGTAYSATKKRCEWWNTVICDFQ